MRIILKPRGAVLLVLMLALLAVVTLVRPQYPSLPFLGGVDLLQTRDTALAGTGRDWVMQSSAKTKPTVTYITDGTVPVDAVPVVQIQQIPASPKSFWESQLERDITGDIPAGRRLVLHFWARAPQPRPIYAVVEQNTAPYDKDLSTSVDLTPAWQEFSLPFTVHAGHASRTAHVTFQLAQTTGDVEIGGVGIRERDSN
jgi:hypothetical protein